MIASAINGEIYSSKKRIGDTMYLNGNLSLTSVTVTCNLVWRYHFWRNDSELLYELAVLSFAHALLPAVHFDSTYGYLSKLKN